MRFVRFYIFSEKIKTIEKKEYSFLNTAKSIFNDFVAFNYNWISLEQEMIENQSSNQKTFTIEHGMAPDIYVPAWKTNVVK